MADNADITALEQVLIGEISATEDLLELEGVRVAALGKKGSISDLMARLGGLPPDQRREFGQAVNGLKQRVGDALDSRKADLERRQLSNRLATETADVTLPVQPGPLLEGRIHPVSLVWDVVV
jgi:phenylalanyl-tRNA synthetase alpha chain